MEEGSAVMALELPLHRRHGSWSRAPPPCASPDPLLQYRAGRNDDGLHKT